jgi:hypothetical protein
LVFASVVVETYPEEEMAGCEKGSCKLHFDGGFGVLRC